MANLLAFNWNLDPGFHLFLLLFYSLNWREILKLYVGVLHIDCSIKA